MKNLLICALLLSGCGATAPGALPKPAGMSAWDYSFGEASREVEPSMANHPGDGYWKKTGKVWVKDESEVKYVLTIALPPVCFRGIHKPSGCWIGPMKTAYVNPNGMSARMVACMKSHEAAHGLGFEHDDRPTVGAIYCGPGRGFVNV